MYWKNQGKTGNRLAVPRHLPLEASQLVARFLFQIMPFATSLELQLQKWSTEGTDDTILPSNDLAFPGVNYQPWESKKLARLMNEYSESELKAKFTYSDWRHVVSAAFDQHIRPLILDDDAFQRAGRTLSDLQWGQTKADDEDETGERISNENRDALQGAHSSKTRDRFYGLQAKDLTTLSLSSMEIFG